MSIGFIKAKPLDMSPSAGPRPPVGCNAHGMGGGVGTSGQKSTGFRHMSGVGTVPWKAADHLRGRPGVRVWRQDQPCEQAPPAPSWSARACTNRAGGGRAHLLLKAGLASDRAGPGGGGGGTPTLAPRRSRPQVAVLARPAARGVGGHRRLRPSPGRRRHRHLVRSWQPLDGLQSLAPISRSKLALGIYPVVDHAPPRAQAAMCAPTSVWSGVYRRTDRVTSCSRGGGCPFFQS